MTSKKQSDWPFRYSPAFCKTLDDFSELRRRELCDAAVHNPQPPIDTIDQLVQELYEVDKFLEEIQRASRTPPTSRLKREIINGREYVVLSVRPWKGYFFVDRKNRNYVAICAFRNESSRGKISSFLDREVDRLSSREAQPVHDRAS